MSWVAHGIHPARDVFPFLMGNVAGNVEILFRTDVQAGPFSSAALSRRATSSSVQDPRYLLHPRMVYPSPVVRAIDMRGTASSGYFLLPQ